VLDVLKSVADQVRLVGAVADREIQEAIVKKAS